MEDKKEHKTSLWNKIVTRHYLNISMHSITKDFLIFLSNLVELLSYIIIIDIIGKYKRVWLSWHALLYFFTPVYYGSFIKNIFHLQAKCPPIENETYQQDQLNLLIVQLFRVPIVSDECINQMVLYGLGIALIIILLFIIVSIKTNMKIVRYFKAISAFGLYLILKTFSLCFLTLFNYPIFIQLSHSHGPITVVFLFDVILMIIYNGLSLYFYQYMIYAYQSIGIYYSLNNKKFPFEFVLNYLSSIIIILRMSNTNRIIFEVFWVITFVFYFYLASYDFIYILNKSNSYKASYAILSFCFSMFITRIITMILINFTKDMLVFQVFELVMALLIVIIVYSTIASYQKIITLSMIDRYLDKNDTLFFYGIYQLFSPLRKFFYLKLNENRMMEKHKEVFFLNYKKALKENFCITKQDFKLINIENDTKIINYQSNSNNHSITTTQEKDYLSVLQTLVKLIDYFNSKAKQKRNMFGERAKEIVVYKKIMLYFIIDEKTFRSEYYLKKFIYSNNFIQTNILIKSLFKYLNTHFRQLEKKGEDNSMSYVILFLYLNNEYLKITKSFKHVLKYFTKTRAEIMKIIDKQSHKIGTCFDKIIKLNDQSLDSIKIKEQPENEKFKLIEDMMFNSNFDKSFEYFDLNSLDGVVEKNNDFIILYEKNNFIIKKAPIEYNHLTGYKTTRMLNKQFADIFPFVMKSIQMKHIKRILLSKTSFTVATVLETNDLYLVNAKLIFTLLPSFNGKLYLVCNIDCDSKIDTSNVAILQKNGYVQSLGLFFHHYFGLSSQSKKLDLLNLFGIKEYDPEQKGTGSFNVNYSNLYFEIQKYLLRENAYQKGDIDEILKKIKEKLQHKTTILLELVMKNHYTFQSNDYYLIQFNFIDLRSTSISNNNIIDKESIAYTRNPNNTISGATHSGSSVLSYKLIKESNWNITSKRKKETYLTKNILDQISLIYNLILIILAIALSVFVKVLSDQFYQSFLLLTSAREIALEFYHGQFYISNMVAIIGRFDIHDSLNDYYSMSIPEYEMDIKDYYQQNFVSLSSKFMLLYTNLINNFTNISPQDQLYPYITKNISMVLNSGGVSNETYLSQFNLPKNYFFILSQTDGYYVRVPYISYDNVRTTLPSLEDNQQYVISLMINTFTFLQELRGVTACTKEVFNGSFKRYKVLIIIMFIVVLGCNIFSLFLLYLSVKMSDKKILAITEKLMGITKKHKEYLHHKTKIIKEIIMNEQKPSIGISILKEKYQYTKGTGLGVSNYNVTNSPQDENNINSIVTNNNGDDNTPLILPTHKKEIYYFKVFIQAIKILFLLASIYAVFTIVSFPIILNYLDLIEQRHLQTESTEDLLSMLLMFYLDIRYSIFFNSPAKTAELDLFGEFTQHIYDNYTLLNNHLFGHDSDSHIEYIDIINETPDCSKILEENEFFDSLNAVCLKEPILQTNIETMVSSFVNQLRAVYNNFITSPMEAYDTRIYFHDRLIQLNTLVMSIFFIPFFRTLKAEYLLPSFQANITALSTFLVIVFVLMVIAETLNYFLSTILIIKRLSNSLSNFSILEKFFITEASTKKN